MIYCCEVEYKPNGINIEEGVKKLKMSFLTPSDDIGLGGRAQPFCHRKDWEANDAGKKRPVLCKRVKISEP